MCIKCSQDSRKQLLHIDSKAKSINHHKFSVEFMCQDNKGYPKIRFQVVTKETYRLQASKVENYLLLIFP